MLLGANDGNTRRSGRDLDGRGRATNDHCAGGYAGCAVSAPASPMVLPGVVLSFFFSWQPAAANSKPAAMSAVRIRMVVSLHRSVEGVRRRAARAGEATAGRDARLVF